MAEACCVKGHVCIRYSCMGTTCDTVIHSPFSTILALSISSRANLPKCEHGQVGPVVGSGVQLLHGWSSKQTQSQPAPLAPQSADGSSIMQQLLALSRALETGQVDGALSVPAIGSFP